MFFALKRALPHTTVEADIDRHLDQQTRRLLTLQREAKVYFSAALNTENCRHLALLYDIAQVRNSDGEQEPLLVLQWADGPCTTLREWLSKHPDTCATIQYRLSFAVQMCAGLRELHHDVESHSPNIATSSSPAHNNSAAGAEAVAATLPMSMPASAFVHHDVKPGNMLLFGGDSNMSGPVRLA